MKCRRCLRGIGEGEVAHLVDRRKIIDADLPPSMHGVIVCSGCKRPDEKRFIEDAEDIPLPVPKLRPLQEMVLRHAVRPCAVYRQPRKVRLRTGPVLLDTDRAVTTDAYVLVNRGFAEWDVIPKSLRTEGGATAWMRVTAEGHAYLKMEDHDAVEAGSR